MTAQALAVPLPVRHRERAVPQERSSKSFVPYLPAFIVAVIKDCLDFVFVALVVIPGVGPVISVVLLFLSGVCLGFCLTGTLLFSLTRSQVPFWARFLAFGVPQVADTLLLGVNLLPGASYAVIRVYQLDRKAELARNLTGRLVA